MENVAWRLGSELIAKTSLRKRSDFCGLHNDGEAFVCPFCAPSGPLQK